MGVWYTLALIHIYIYPKVLSNIFITITVPFQTFIKKKKSFWICVYNDEKYKIGHFLHVIVPQQILNMSINWYQICNVYNSRREYIYKANSFRKFLQELSKFQKIYYYKPKNKTKIYKFSTTFLAI